MTQDKLEISWHQMLILIMISRMSKHVTLKIFCASIFSMAMTQFSHSILSNCIQEKRNNISVNGTREINKKSRSRREKTTKPIEISDWMQ
jgi:hypothetical protein